jgi:competence protein ComEC
LCWVLENKATLGYAGEAITYERVTANKNKNSLINSNIDPIGDTECDPVIKILSGGFTERPGEWDLAEFDNKNNHSLVIRVDLGQASFLFTGDLECAGIDEIVEYYRPASEKDPNLLDIDVYQVGHHGSPNGTAAYLLMETTPEIAVISVGKWDFGKDGKNGFTTYWYGHPRKAIIDLLTIAIPKYRSSLPKQR